MIKSDTHTRAKAPITIISTMSAVVAIVYFPYCIFGCRRTSVYTVRTWSPPTGIKFQIISDVIGRNLNFAEFIIALVPARQSSATRKPSPSFNTAAPSQDREGCTSRHLRLRARFVPKGQIEVSIPSYPSGMLRKVPFPSGTLLGRRSDLSEPVNNRIRTNRFRCATATEE
jgi:hypothetical protein